MKGLTEHIWGFTTRCVRSSSFWEYFSSLSKLFSFLFQTMCLIPYLGTHQSRLKCPLNSDPQLSIPKHLFPDTLNFFPVSLTFMAK